VGFDPDPDSNFDESGYLIQPRQEQGELTTGGRDAAGCPAPNTGKSIVDKKRRVGYIVHLIYLHTYIYLWIRPWPDKPKAVTGDPAGGSE